MIEICAIAINENDYLDEWVEHHLSLGFDRITIYDNGSNVKWTTDNPKVRLRERLGKEQQLPLYKEYAQTTDSDWVAFIDIDEFIMINGTIQEFLEKYKDYSGIQLPWVMYGANGQYKQEPGRVQDRFTLISPNQVQCYAFKSIVRPKDFISLYNPHDIQVNGQTILINKDEATLNHYYTKSLEEWTKKVARGRIDVLAGMDYYYFFNFNPDMTTDKIN